jgi:hypothetical protein
MKFAKSLAVGALALALASVASAATLKITGSTAFRKSLYASIIKQGYGQAAYVGANLAGANQVLFTNGTDYVEVCLAGSVGGIKWVATSAPVGTSPTADTSKSWLKTDGTIAVAACASAGTSPYAVTGGNQEAASQGAVVASHWDVASTADVTMSDSFQKSTPYTAAVTGTNLTDSQTGVGVVTFVFAKGLKHPDVSQAAYDRFTNVSAVAFQNLAANGVAPLEMFTGNPSDRTVDVILTGRDNDSGTRLAAFFETGFGNVDQYSTQYQFFGGATDAGSATGVTIDTATAFDLISGQAGYSGGGSVKNVLLNSIAGGTVDSNGRAFIILGYVGIGDTPGTSQQLTYEGATYDAAGEAVNYGQYTFWTREHLYYRPALTGAPKTLADNIAKGIKATPGTATSSGLLISGLKVSRASEGAVVNPLY